MTLDKQREVWYYNKALDSCITCGGVAHLGERLNGIQEVVGSIPIISTKQKPVRPLNCWLCGFLLFLKNLLKFPKFVLLHILLHILKTLIQLIIPV